LSLTSIDGLQLEAYKSRAEIFWFDSARQVRHLSRDCKVECVPGAAAVRDLGVTLDTEMPLRRPFRACFKRGLTILVVFSDINEDLT